MFSDRLEVEVPVGRHVDGHQRGDRLAGRRLESRLQLLGARREHVTRPADVLEALVLLVFEDVQARSADLFTDVRQPAAAGVLHHPGVRLLHQCRSQHGGLQLAGRVGVLVVAPPAALDLHVGRLDALARQDLPVERAELVEALPVRLVVELLVSEVHRLHAVTQQLHLLAARREVVAVAVDDHLLELEVVDVLQVDARVRHRRVFRSSGNGTSKCYWSGKLSEMVQNMLKRLHSSWPFRTN